MYRYFFKPLIDFVLALIGLVVLLLPFLILILAIKIDSRGPIFFKQKRIGKHKKRFTIYKFRTMRIDTPADTPTHLLDDPSRYITKVGKFLRKTSLDELPQILNILFGQMSIIGPRPALWNQDDLIAARDEYGANNVRPGLTGWAQVNGRDELPIAQKAKLDGEYIKRLGFFFDCKVFFKTIAKVFRSDGVVEGGTGAMARSSQQEPDALAMDSITEEAASVQESVLLAQNEPAVDDAVTKQQQGVDDDGHQSELQFKPQQQDETHQAEQVEQIDKEQEVEEDSNNGSE